MGLLARGLEIAGIATTMTTWRDGTMRIVKPPRVTLSRLPRGAAVGAPHDAAQQRRILEATLVLLEQDAPLNPVKLDETLPD